MTEDQFDIAMALITPSLRGSPDYDPEADYKTQDAIYDELVEFTKYEWLNNRKRGEYDS